MAVAQELPNIGLDLELAALIDADVPTVDYSKYEFEDLTGDDCQTWHNVRCKSLKGLDMRNYPARQTPLQKDISPSGFWQKVTEFICPCRYSVGASMVGKSLILYRHINIVGKWAKISRNGGGAIRLETYQFANKRRSTSGTAAEHVVARPNRMGRNVSLARFGNRCISGNEQVLWRTVLMQAPLDTSTSFVDRLRIVQTNFPDLIQVGQEHFVLRSTIYKRNDPSDRVLYRSVQVPFFLTNAPNPVRVSWTGGRKIGRLDANSVNHVLVGGIPDTRKVQNALGGEWAVAQDLAQRISGNLMLSQTIIDNTGLYTIGWIIWAQVSLWAMARRNNPQLGDLVPRPFVEGALVCRSVRPANAEEAHNHFSEDLTVGRIVLRSDSWTDEDLIVLGQIASGLPRFDVPAQEGRVISFNCFDTPTIPFACYSRGPRVIPAVRNLGSDVIRGVLIKLSIARGEEDQLVAGFVRASTLVYGTMMRGEGQVSYIGPMMEMHHITLPLPSDSNWMWRALGSVEASGDNAASKTDFELIGSTGTSHLVGVQLLLGRAMGIGLSIILQHFNFGGEELTSWLGVQPHSATTIATFRRLTAVLDGDGYAAIYRLAAHVVNELFALRVPISAFWGSLWNGVGTALLYTRIPNFRSHWGLNIPYIGQPLAVCCLLIKWPSIWGFLAPPIKIDIKDEIIRRRPYNAAYTWRPYYGTSEFQNKPRYVQCEYVPLVLNAVWQHTGLEPNISWLAKWPTSKEWTPEEALDVNLQWDPHTGIRIGSCRSYFWAHNCQVTPELEWDADREQIWMRLLAMCGQREEQQMGLSLPNALNQEYAFVNADNYLSQILGSLSLAGSDDKQQEQEN